MADNISGYFRSQRDENRRQREIAELMRKRRLRESAGETLTDEEEAEYRAQVESREFGAYQVTPLPNKPELYGKGPSKSTRLNAHKFVPLVRGNNELGNPLIPNTGNVYIRFNRPSKKQIEEGGATVVYRYSNVPVAVYESFRNNASKGRYVNQVMNSFRPERVDESSTEFSRYCADL